jgi:flagellar biosynthesis/type III secretory pathway protein FliH
MPAADFEALARARALVAGAEGEARRRLEEAAAGAAAERQQARAAGRAEGRAEAAAALLEAAAERDRMLAAAGPEVVALALELARKVLGREPRSGQEEVAALATRALSAARAHRGARLRVSPGDLGVARAAVPAGVEVEADPELGPGACAVLTASGRIEAGVEAQLDELARVLLGAEVR